MANYKATFILDTRGREENADELVEGLKGELEGAGAEVTSAQNLGKHDFARAADRRCEHAQKCAGKTSLEQTGVTQDNPEDLIDSLTLTPVSSHAKFQ
jgi:small subunit ribosomal protein S6